MLTATNIHPLLPESPPLRSREDIEAEIDELHDTEDQIETLMALIKAYDLYDLFSADALAGYECESGAETLAAMKSILRAKMKEVKGE